MKKLLEKVSILSLSLVLTTSFSISSALPYMFEYYKDLPKSQIELLVSLPSAGIMVTLFLNTFIERFLDERKMIITGLLILSIFGMVPFFNQTYPILFISRFIFGMGVGLINAKAISIISERYQGRERIQTLGFRGSAEVVGTALVTLLVGFLLQFGWTSSFLAYGAGLIVLFLFMTFVPYHQQEESQYIHANHKEPLQKEEWKLTIILAIVAAMIVLCNVGVTLRIPSIVAYTFKDQHNSASFILSAMQLIGILAGITFFGLVHLFKSKLITYAGIAYGISMMAVALSPSISLLALSALFSGYTYSTALTMVFQILSAKIPARRLNQVTSVAVLGCSFGAAITPFALNTIGLISDSNSFIFTVLGIAMALLAFSLLYLLKDHHE
ncbi:MULTISPECIES: MFS transporter [Streptococcus]|uniref:Arabinose efflux permease n=1 Tax=Streptococcus viridans TaxID=78535 RepID=A0A447Z568_9STRE|nr:MULTISPECIES: MFS transporter [Streptococcus]VED67339.1 arabinose efflux permease [Streptococcus viridans]VEE19680.1 arabinose efflux permease [Streptococcus australis]